MARLIQFRCVFVSVMLGAFAGLLAGRFDPSSSFDWHLIFIPLWIVDLVAVVYLLRDFIRVKKETEQQRRLQQQEQNEDTVNLSNVVVGNVGNLKRTAWLVCVSVLLAIFKALVALRLNSIYMPVAVIISPLMIVLIGSAVDIISQSIGLKPVRRPSWMPFARNSSL